MMIRMKHLFPVIALFLFASAHAQSGFKRTQNKMLDEAELLMQGHEYAEAAKIYRRLVPEDTGFAEVSYNLGLCEWNLPGRWENSAPHFAKAVQSNNTEAHFMLALCRHRQQRFDEALQLFTMYKLHYYRAVDNEEVARRMAICTTAKALTRLPEDQRIVNMGTAVNSKAHDYSPLVTADRSRMFFTSRREGTTGSERDQNGQWYEDIWTSSCMNGTWMPAQNAGKPLNTSVMDATVGISPTGDTLLIYRSDADLNGGDLFMTHRTGNGWSQPEMLTEKVNSGSHEPSASLGPGGTSIYFTSDREGGQGGRDIWCVKRLPTGAWSEPQNLGPSVNTMFDEDAPFMHADGKTLFFSSNGHSTMGGYDIFKSALLEPEGNAWTVAQNMGYPLNTVNDDIYFCLSDDGTTGFFSSERAGGSGAQDIYQVTFPTNQLDFVAVLGVVTDAMDEPLRAKITLIDLTQGETHGVYNTNGNTGRYLMVVEPGRRYRMLVESEGCVAYTGEFDPSSAHGEREMLLDIRMTRPVAQANSSSNGK